jgi:hypothetical protein
MANRVTRIVTSAWIRTALTVALVLAFSRDSGAATPSESAAAQALFDKARQLMAAGKYTLACPKLEESQRLDPSTGTLLNLGSCYEHEGRIAAAWSKFLEAEASARASGNPERAAGAHEHAARLAPRLAKLVIDVAGSQLEGLQVHRDGEVVGAAQWGVAIPVDAGEHTVVVSAPGRKSWQSKVTLQGDGSTASVAVPVLEPASGGGAPAGTPGEHPAADLSPSSKARGLRVASYVALGVGVVGVGVGTVFGLRSMSLRGQADDICPDPNRCPISQRDKVQGLDDDARSAKTLSTIGFVAGGAAAGAGVALLALAVSKPAVASLEPQLRPWFGLSSFGVAGSF